ncbi:MAG: cell division coordinator CpoB [Sodalis sp. Fse]|nr:MAG: cell division coordinator CpoB [Sodalis sp. Fse]
MRNNLRAYLLSVLLLMCIAVQRSAIAQASISNIGSGALDDRITKLERISNAHSRILTQLQQLLYDNQRDIDLLRGQIQENQHHLSQMVEREKKIYQQIDSLNNHIVSSVVDLDQPIVDKIIQSAPVLPITSSGDPNIDYNEAVALVLEKKQYDQAISAFQNFVRCYPASTYQSNANYWLGQLNYKKGKKDDAVYYFALVVKNYPKSSKAPDALLKVGVIMQEKGQKDKARLVYKQVGKLYPSADAAKQAHKYLISF